MTALRELRGRGAPTTLAIDPASGHNCGNARYLTIPLIAAVLDSQSTGMTLELEGFQGGVWIPNQAIGFAWDDFVKTGKVSDLSPPLHSPTDVHAEQTAEGVTLSWKAQPDWESGIQTFRIYRDGVALPDYTTPTRNPDEHEPYFRRPNYSDTPHPPLSQMRHIDSEAPVGIRVSYQVSTVN